MLLLGQTTYPVFSPHNSVPVDDRGNCETKKALLKVINNALI